MDNNKLIKLKLVNYKILPTCATCQHGQFGLASWGTCSLVSYKHEKHSLTDRQMSIHQSGSCDLYVRDKESKELLGAFQEFI